MARVHVGRKPGGTNARTRAMRAIADEALQSGCHPLEVMLNNMRFYHNEAQGILAQILAAVKAGGKKLGLEHLELLGKLYNTRNEAQKCAVDAAPYVHARLSAIAVSGSVDHRLAPPPDNISPKQLAEILERNLRASPVPMKFIEAPKKKDAA